MALSKEAREFFAKEGRKGGLASAKKLSPQERKDSARKAAEARWAKFDKTLAQTNAILDRVEKSAKKAKAKKKGKQ